MQSSLLTGNGTLNKLAGIDFKQLSLSQKLNENQSGEVWRPFPCWDGRARCSLSPRLYAEQNGYNCLRGIQTPAWGHLQAGSCLGDLTPHHSHCAALRDLRSAREAEGCSGAASLPSQ